MNLYPESLSSPTSLAISSIIHQSRLTVCLPGSLDLDLLSIDFVLVKSL